LYQYNVAFFDDALIQYSKAPVDESFVMDTIWLPRLDPGISVKHQALKSSIRGAIADGTLAAGARLPPVREVAWKLGITAGTVARAYKDLVDATVLAAVVGRGTFVAEPADLPPPEPEMSFLTEAWPEDEVNLRSAQVADVGQGAVFHRLLTTLPLPAADHYVSYPTIAADAPLRRELAQWFASDSHGPIAPEDMVLTSGAQHGMVVLFQALLHGPRPVILTEELAYPGFRHAAALVRASIQGVPFDDEGLLPDAFDAACRETGAQVLCTSAETHNPTTIRTTPARRAAILAIARQHGLQIVDDDCFGLSSDVAPGYRVLGPERSWVISSLSKTLSPDLRVGVIVTPQGRAGLVRAAAQQQFFGLSRPLVDLVQAAMTSGEARAIRGRMQVFQDRRLAQTRAVLGPYGIVTRDRVPFAWLRMPRGWRASSFLRAAEAHGIRLKAADEFALIDGRAPNAVRLALTGTRSDARFDAALLTLAGLLSAPPHEIDI